MEDSKSPTWLISELSSSVYDVACVAGEKMRGIRLEPGTQIDQLALVQWMKSHHVNELFIADQIDEFCERSTSLSEILQCLSHQEAESVQAVANELGVSLRTLQRVIKSGTQRTPYFWFSLARMRRTAKALHKFDRLADVATAFNFSDQAHMTRDMKLWLGLPPSQIKRDIELQSLLSEPGYA
ncbi:MAG: AraC family transcriptional regulator [Arenicella sp.]|nr:AraC family transcriptional regulator [Arenicella sp.]